MQRTVRPHVFSMLMASKILKARCDRCAIGDPTMGKCTVKAGWSVVDRPLLLGRHWAAVVWWRPARSRLWEGPH